MGKQVDQGTRFESRMRRLAVGRGRIAARTAKTGKKHEPDLVIAGTEMRPAVAWEKWVGRKGQGRRRAVRMVAIPEYHYGELLALDTEHRYGYYVQCKSTQAGSLHTWLEGLIERIETDA